MRSGGRPGNRRPLNFDRRGDAGSVTNVAQHRLLGLATQFVNRLSLSKYGVADRTRIETAALVGLCDEPNGQIHACDSVFPLTIPSRLTASADATPHRPGSPASAIPRPDRPRRPSERSACRAGSVTRPPTSVTISTRRRCPRACSCSCRSRRSRRAEHRPDAACPNRGCARRWFRAGGERRVRCRCATRWGSR